MRKRTIACVALLALALAACDDNPPATDAGVDSGPAPDGGPADTGPGDVDAGPQDAGTDAETPDGGPPPAFEVRLVNNVPGYAGLEVCLWASLPATGPIAASKEWLTETLGAVPFRGVSPYRERPLVAGIDFVVGLYAVPTAARAGWDCPADPFAPVTTDPMPNVAVVAATVPGGAVTDGSRSSAIATGFDEGTLGAAPGALPSRCDATTGFTALCPEATATTLVLVPDDQTAPAAGMARIRVSNQIANTDGLPGFLVCYDPGLTPLAAGACAPGAADAPEALVAAPVAYETVTAYADRDPIQPTIPAAGAGGGIYLSLATTAGATCPGFSTLPATSQRCYPIITAFPAPGPGSDNIQPNITAGDIATIFISGVAIAGAPDADVAPYVPAFFIWQDNLVVTAP